MRSQNDSIENGCWILPDKSCVTKNVYSLVLAAAELILVTRSARHIVWIFSSIATIIACVNQANAK